MIVSVKFLCFGKSRAHSQDQFTIYFHYSAGPNRVHPFTAILRAHILSVRSPQVRYIVRGTQGTYIKYGLDVQEDQLKVISTPNTIHEEHYGEEPESQWGILENIEADYITVTKTMCVFEHANILVTEFFSSSWPSSAPGSYVELFKNLGAGIRNNADLAVKWEEATSVIEMVELAHRSSREEVTVSVPTL